ncbi:type VII secretion-associated serine protease mycosin [Kitasatospora xanthocidica]|uniref:Type VII secretion-associated serine protease mycosin n=1 Tax=Kitasatospora xanthocidica TaxID=83382 RepID=A0A373A0D0_9ACTN|nr:S8 family serine peptidase [Kitasatospora xanthocidica]RGD61090.1 type VII secretion-associated serine protease mycosin [Kitasatospora xanthocidica]
MGRTNARARWRAAAAALLAAGIVVGPVAAPAVAEDTIRQQQWHLEAMHAPEMWKVTKGRGITVAVIDSGFKLDHPDLEGQFLPGQDFSGSPGGVGSAADGHGTGMSSLIAGTGKGNGGTGALGLAPGVKVLPLKINTGKVGSIVSTDFLGQIGQAISYAVDQGAKVINISQGIDAVTAYPADVTKLNGIIAAARDKGVLVFASVGNEAEKGNPVEYPGALPGVVGVGASDRNGTVTAESERGPQVVFVAPGMDMIAACTSPTGYCKSHGTSDSTAMVSASAALVWAAHPDWTGNQVLRVLINTAGKANDGSGRNDLIGFGAVRPRIALTDPGDPGPANVSPLPVGTPAPSGAPSPSATAPAAGSAVPIPVETPTDVAAGAPSVQPKAEASSGSGSALPIVAGVVAGLVLVAGVVFAVVRRRKSAAQPDVAQVPPLPSQQPMGAVPPAPPSYQPPVPPEDNPYAR